MKHLITFSLFFFFITSIFSQTTLSYRICNWYSNKKAVATVTFDDNYDPQFTAAMPEMNTRKIVGTFFVCTGSGGYPINWTYAKQAAQAGHEIASHSITHPHWRTGFTEVMIRDEMRKSRDTIESRIGNKCITIAWPYGEGGGGNDTMLRRIAKDYFISGRNASSGSGYETDGWIFPNIKFFNDRFFRVGANLMQGTTTKNQVTTWLNGAITNRAWCDFLYHSVSNGSTYLVPLDTFKRHMDAIVEKSNDVWITTFANASIYGQERKTTKINKLSENTSTWVLSIQDSMINNSIFNHPLTLRFKKPTWVIDSIKQGTSKLSFSTETDTIQLDAIPDAGNITFYKNPNTAYVNVVEDNLKCSINPNPLTNQSNVSFNLNIPGNVSIYIVNSSGEIIFNQQLYNQSVGLKSIVINKGDMKKGIYFIKLVTKQNISVNKLIVN